MNLYEILVPTRMHKQTVNGIIDWTSDKPIKTRHHKKWDEFVQKISGGLTLLKPASGKWVDKSSKLYEEKVIPVRIACTQEQIEQIVKFTLRHYRQKAVMYYKVSSDVFIVENPEL